MKLISIVTVVLNNPTGLKRTIESVACQKTDAIEYIVIDGKSSASSVEIANSFRNHIDIFISEKDNGIYDAMNKGISLCTGKFILLLNAADTLVQHSLGQILKDLNNWDCGNIYYGDSIHTYNDRSSSRLIFGSHEKLLGRMSISHQAVFIPNAIYKGYGNYDLHYKLASDFDFLLKLALGGITFKYIGIPIAYFETGGASDKKMISSRIECIKILWRNKSPQRISGTLNYCKEIAMFHIYKLITKIFGTKIASHIRELYQKV